MAYRVLVVEPVDKAFSEALSKCGVEVEYKLGIGREELLEKVKDYDVLVVRTYTRVDEELMKRGVEGRLKVVARAGVGLDNIDLEAAQRLGVKVVNAPTASTQSVAELTIGLMIAAARRIVELHNKLCRGEWERAKGVELYGKTLFVVGFGRIGRRVAEIAKAIGMKVIAYDIIDVSEEARKRGVELVSSLCEGLRRADVVSLHVPLTKDTYHMINRETLKCFKKGAILVNTARGKVMDTGAVLEALEQGILSAVATDVHEHEPPTEKELELIRHPRVVATPHIGAQTYEAQRRVALELAAAVAKALNLDCTIECEV